jgi:hypothetical protein
VERRKKGQDRETSRSVGDGVHRIPTVDDIFEVLYDCYDVKYDFYDVQYVVQDGSLASHISKIFPGDTDHRAVRQVMRLLHLTDAPCPSCVFYMSKRE